MLVCTVWAVSITCDSRDYFLRPITRAVNCHHDALATRILPNIVKVLNRNGLSDTGGSGKNGR